MLASPLPVASTFPPLRRGAFTTLQVNLGYRCNQACSHCHVDAGPHRSESMEAATLALIVPVLAPSSIPGSGTWCGRPGPWGWR
jgi:hypothetical protein